MSTFLGINFVKIVFVFKNFGFSELFGANKSKNLVHNGRINLCQQSLVDIFFNIQY
jgi:hypothetical protein